MRQLRRHVQRASFYLTFPAANLFVAFAFTYLYQDMWGPLSEIGRIELLMIFFIMLNTLLLYFDLRAMSQYILDDQSPDADSPRSLDSRIAELLNSLRQASTAVSSIEAEIQSRQDLADKLQSQKRVAENAISLSKAQVDAVAQTLTIEFSRAERRGVRRDYLLFASGVLASAAVAIVLRAVGI